MLMNQFVHRLHSFTAALAKDSTGATAIEYGLLAALIAIVIVTGVQTIAPNINTTFTTISGKL
jgi:pilus assembly protein Flp/PilA